LGKKAGDIPLTNAVIEANPANPYGRSHLFGIKPAGQTRIYVVEAPSAAIKDEWIRTIRSVGDKASLHAGKQPSPTFSSLIHTRQYMLTGTGRDGLVITGSVKEGFMFKVGGNVKSWKNRYFVLTRDKLSYFKAPKDKKSQGEIPLASGALLASESLESSGKPYAFSVSPTGQGRKYMLQANDENGRNEWMAAIRQVATSR
jgi:hypothetical protein